MDDDAPMETRPKNTSSGEKMFDHLLEQLPTTQVKLVGFDSGLRSPDKPRQTVYMEFEIDPDEFDRHFRNKVTIGQTFRLLLPNAGDQLALPENGDAE